MPTTRSPRTRINARRILTSHSVLLSSLGPVNDAMENEMTQSNVRCCLGFALVAVTFVPFMLTGCSVGDGSDTFSDVTTSDTGEVDAAALEDTNPTDERDVEGDGPREEGDPSTSDGIGSPPPWVPDQPGPWDGAMHIATSSDGLQFTPGELFLDHAGVPCLTRTTDHVLIATYQYFSFENEAEFGYMAYSVSTDEGTSWSDPEVISLEGLPAYGNALPVDPALVQLDDGDLRLYFTLHAQGDQHTHVAAARAASISETFTYEGELFRSEDANLLDPTVIFFDGSWHYFTPVPGGTGTMNHHATSADGLHFTAQDDINIDMNMLGNPVVVDGGIRFFGSGLGGVVSAFSTDGFEWTLDDGFRAPGVDPGISQLSDGSFMLIYVAPRNAP